MSDISISRRARLAGVALAAFAAACAYPERPWDAPLPQDRHPITVRETRSLVEVAVRPERTGLTYEDKAALGALAQEYLAAGQGPVVIAQPIGGPDDAVAVRVGAEIRELFYDHGVAFRLVQGTAYDATGRADAPLVVMVDRYVTDGPECHEVWRDFARTSRGENTWNFGCATQANIAAVVADPGDFIAPRGMTPSDAARRSEVLRRYRAGEATGTVRADSESATVSDVGE